VTVHAGDGQSLVVSRNGTEVQRIPVVGDPFSTTIDASRDPGEGPLGTFWRVDVANDITLTAIGNPVFLADAAPPAKQRGPVPAVAPVVPNFPQPPAPPPAASPPSNSSKGATSTALIVAFVAGGALVLLLAVLLVRRRRPAA
jgi:hypothetical protein